MRQPKVALSLDQYKILLERKRQANGRNVKYKDLIKQWGVKHYHMSTAVYRGIKHYDYILWKEDNRMAKSIALQIAEHIGCDIADIKDYEYQPGNWSRKVYAGMDGNRYWSAGGGDPPRYRDEESGITWRRVKSNWLGNPDLWVGEHV